MVEKEEKKKCLNCKKMINLKKDHYVLVSTCNRSKSPDEHSYFHFQCWIDYFNRCVMNKSRSQIRGMQEKAMQVMNNPMIKGILSQIQGSDIAMNMLQLPLPDVVVISKEKVAEKIQNDRKKRAKGNKKKMQKV